MATTRTIAKLLDPVLTEFECYHSFEQLSIRFIREFGDCSSWPGEVHVGLVNPDPGIDDNVWWARCFTEELLHVVQYETEPLLGGAELTPEQLEAMVEQHKRMESTENLLLLASDILQDSWLAEFYEHSERRAIRGSRKGSPKERRV